MKIDLAFILRDCGGNIQKAQKRIDRGVAELVAENLSLRTHHTALLSALTKLADQGYWSKRAKESWMRVVLDEYVDFAKDALASLKPPHLDTAPNPPHPAEKGSGTLISKHHASTAELSRSATATTASGTWTICASFKTDMRTLAG